MTRPTFHLEKGPQIVRLWADRRPPFEPKGDMSSARDQLRLALKALAVSSEEILDATYTSRDTGFCDVENVLIYNLGPASVRHLTTSGLQFQRSWQRPDDPGEAQGSAYEHLVEYRTIPVTQDPPSTWGPPAASFDFHLPQRLDVHSVWWSAAHPLAVQVHEPISGRFWLHVAIEVPEGTRWTPAGATKPVLDGIIAAMHPGHAVDPTAISILATKLGQSEPDVRDRLLNPVIPVLAPRTVLRPYRGSIKWDPGDENVVKSRLTSGLGRAGRCNVSLGSLNIRP